MVKYYWFVFLEYQHGEHRKKYGSCGFSPGWIDVGARVTDGVRCAYAQLAGVPLESRLTARIQTGVRLMSALTPERRSELLRRVTAESTAFQEVNHLTA